MQQRGRVTIPTDVDVVPETLTLMERWGADAIRDCDGTDYPEELRAVDAKVYSTYYTTRKDNTWAKAHPEEIQQMYIMTPFYTAVDGDLQIHLMTHLYPDMLKVNNRDDITRWWEVIDRTTGAVVSTSQWSYDETTGDVNGRILSIRLLLMCASQRPTPTPWSGCADLSRSIRMWMSSATRPFFTNLRSSLTSWRGKNMWIGMAIPHRSARIS